MTRDEIDQAATEFAQKVFGPAAQAHVERYQHRGVSSVNTLWGPYVPRRGHESFTFVVSGLRYVDHSPLRRPEPLPASPGRTNPFVRR